MFRIKICGITSVKDAQLSMLAGADAVGFNFCDQSKRKVDLKAADEIAKVVARRVAKVGIFVNSTADEINRIADRLSLDQVQLHGDEPPEICGQLSGRSIVRAFRFQKNGFATILDYLDQCRSSWMPDALLIDAYKAAEYGGTGEVVDWHALAKNTEQFGDLPIVLAGGLTPFNVGQAIATIKPAAVDTASGVETAPGNKDPMLVRAFVNAARKAFQELERKS